MYNYNTRLPNRCVQEPGLCIHSVYIFAAAAGVKVLLFVLSAIDWMAYCFEAEKVLVYGVLLIQIE